MASIRVSKRKIDKLERDLNQWNELSEEVVKELRELADNLDEHFARIKKAKIGGAAASIGGGILAAVGFGLSFFTFGTSLGLTTAGGVISGAGGATLAGSMITDAVLAKNRKKSADELLNKYNDTLESIKKQSIEIGKILDQSFHGVEKSFPHWVNFWAVLALGPAGAAKGTTWHIIAERILTFLRIHAFKIAVLNTAAGIALRPLNIYALVQSSINEHIENPHQVSVCLRELARKIKKECPTKETIIVLIDELRMQTQVLLT